MQGSSACSYCPAGEYSSAEGHLPLALSMCHTLCHSIEIQIFGRISSLNIPYLALQVLLLLPTVMHALQDHTASILVRQRKTRILFNRRVRWYYFNFYMWWILWIVIGLSFLAGMSSCESCIAGSYADLSGLNMNNPQIGYNCQSQLHDLSKSNYLWNLKQLFNRSFDLFSMSRGN